MNKYPSIVAGIVASVALIVATASNAQPFNGMGQGPGQGMGMGIGMGPGHGRMGGGDPSAIAESRLTDLKTQLKISAAQEAAWQAYAAQAKQQAAAMQALRAQMNQGAATAPERMAQQTAMMQQRSAAMTARNTAFSALYAVLTPEQKTIADKSFGQMGQRGMRFGHHAG